MLNPVRNGRIDRMKPLVLVGGLAISLAMVAFTQAPTTPAAPPKAPQKKGTPPHQFTAGERQQIEAKADELAGLIRTLRAVHSDETLLADVEIFYEAARWKMAYPEEFFRQRSVADTLAVLDKGLERAAQLKEGQFPWM